ncbi:MAG: adenosylhomocysteinase [Archaeoglobaceae archaeon]|nr:adenosylhomocysteinase [Archaeoglobaceae archaeon]MDW7989488.1 adenosylhomocysteinase [Archaeoglobaceae archaeon]
MEGFNKISWAERHMKVLENIREEMEKDRPLEGLRIGMALHVEAKTAVLVKTLISAGAEIAITACNPMSTQDDISEALRSIGVKCFARRGMSVDEYYKAIRKVADFKPDIVIDDGADLIFELHKRGQRIRGASEETTTGVLRLKAMEREGVLLFPVIAVNDALTKFLFDNRYGTGQSTIDGIMRATNMLLAGKKVVVAGYGWCGRGIAMRCKGMGANVIVTEVDEIRALEALMDGFEVMPMSKACEIGEIFITATGNRDVIREEHMRKMKDGVILANAGHFNVEVSVSTLEKMAKSVKEIRSNIKEYDLGGKKLYLLADGRLVNLVAGDGHPIEVMDMSFSNQALAVRYIAENWKELDNRVYRLPEELDRKVARLKLKTLGIEIDKLTEEQIHYISDWRCGT